MSEVSELLKKIKESNKRVEENNKRKTQIDADRRATMKRIVELGEKLKEKGISLKLELDTDGFLTKESLADFKTAYEKELLALQNNYEKTETLLTAIENKDIETINRLTGASIKENSMSIHLASLSELKEREKEIKNGEFTNSSDLNFGEESKAGFLDVAKEKKVKEVVVEDTDDFLDLVDDEDVDDLYVEEDEDEFDDSDDSEPVLDLTNDDVFGVSSEEPVLDFAKDVKYEPVLEETEAEVEEDEEDLENAWLNF